MSIKISPKHGVNPMVPKCFFCLEDKNEVVLAGRLPGDAEAPHGAVIDRVPCDRCREVMAAGVLFISVDESKSPDRDNPYRTGGWAVVTDDAVRRCVSPPELAEKIVRARMAFVPDDAWDLLGLPRDAVEGVPSSVEEFKASQQKPEA